MNRLIFTLLAITCFVSSTYAQKSMDKNLRISIVTCAPGKDIYSIYGHNAIRITDLKAGTDLVYNYGTFDFSTKGFVYKFMRGKLPYTLAVEDYERFIAEYNYFERSVMEQELKIDSLQKNKIVEYLSINMLPQNRTYKYDFFMDNCATRLRDIIDKNVYEFNWDQNNASGKTFRQIIKEYQSVMPWIDFGVDLIIGAPADRVTTLREETFIPDYLAQAIQKATYTDTLKTKLVNQQNQILQFNHSNSETNFLLSPYFIFITLLIFEINLFFRHLKNTASTLARKYDLFWFILITFCSLLMIFMWFGTDHIPTKYNWNIIWASPLIPVWWWLHSRKNYFTKGLTYILSLSFLITIINAIPGLQFLPQYFHPITAIISVILLIKGRRILLSS